MNAEQMRFTADWATALLKLRGAVERGESVALTVDETKAMFHGIRLGFDKKAHR